MSKRKRASGGGKGKDDVMQERRRQRDFQKKQQLVQQAFNQEGELKKSWMEQVLDVDELEKKLQENTIQHIQAMVNKQWVLGNLTDAEAHDRVYKLEVMKLKILGAHPPAESLVQGKVRAFLYDDKYEQMEALTPRERNSIDQIITTLQTMVTRSRGGFERKQINTSIAVSETGEEQQDDSDGWGGLFS